MDLQGNFLIPSKKKRYLDILQIIKYSKGVSQHGISKEIKASSAIVNKYLADLTREKYIRVKKISGRQHDYLLSRKGEVLYKDLTLAYHAELVRCHTAVKNVIMENIKDKLAGYERIGIFGASETGELVSNILDVFGKKIICAFDNDVRKQGTSFYGLQVYSASEIPRILPEAIIITSIGRQDEIFSQLVRDIGNESIRVLRSIS